jgi:hypothetical protein
MLPNLPKPQVSLLPKVRRSNQATQVRQFFLSQPTQIPLHLPKHSQHPNACLTKRGMPMIRLWWVSHGSKQALHPHPLTRSFSLNFASAYFFSDALDILYCFFREVMPGRCTAGIMWLFNPTHLMGKDITNYHNVLPMLTVRVGLPSLAMKLAMLLICPVHYMNFSCTLQVK